jgi:CBS domain containing-hemolysin-like protein
MMQLTGLKRRLRHILEKFLRTDAETAEPHASVVAWPFLEMRDVMIPRTDIVAVDTKAAKAQLVALCAEKKYTALPVFQDKLDHIIGFIALYDLAAMAETDLIWRPQIQNAFFVPPSMSAQQALIELRRRHLPFLLVVDEYGGVDGLVTLQDILEVLLEKATTFEETTPSGVIYPEGGAPLVDGRLSLEDFVEAFGPLPLAFDERTADDVTTVGGLVCHIAGHVPLKGEVITHASGLTFEVVDADPRRVRQVALTLPPASPSVSQDGQEAHRN